MRGYVLPSVGQVMGDCEGRWEEVVGNTAEADSPLFHLENHKIYVNM